MRSFMRRVGPQSAFSGTVTAWSSSTRPLTPPASPDTHLVSSTGVLVEPKRFKTGQVEDLIVNFDNPRQALINVREKIKKLEDDGKEGHTLWMHMQINLALCHFHLGDLELAHECDKYAHSIITKHRGSDHHAAFFSAMTCKNTAKALREKVEELIKVRDSAPIMDKITMGAHKADQANVLVSDLKKEETDMHNYAQRLFWSPKHYYMRQRETKYASAAWDDEDSRAYDEGRMTSPWDKRKRKAPQHKAERAQRNKKSKYRTPR